MKNGDMYRHFNGGKYAFICIALPLKDKLIEKLFHNIEVIKTLNVRYHENTHDLKVYITGNGASFIDSDVPHVLYQNMQEQDWAREVDDFFGYKTKEDGQLVKRFTLETLYHKK